jgi:uncharacterized protein YggE
VATVTVRGEGSAPVTPVGVDVVLTIEADDEHPEDALEAAAARNDVLDQALDELGVSKEARKTVGTRVAERFEYDRDGDRRRSVGFRATVVILVSLDDLASVGAVLRDATARVGAMVDGPTWRLAPDDPASVRARTVAAEAARRNAETYAEAFGYRLGQLISATEPPDARGYVLSAATAKSVERLDISPGQQTVTATIEATFELESSG